MPYHSDEATTSHNSKSAFSTHGPFRIFAWLSPHRDHSGEPYERDSAIAMSRGGGSNGYPATGSRPPSSGVFTRQIMQISYAPFMTDYDCRGLPPPPRHQRSGSQLECPRQSGLFKSAPSLSAFGPKRGARSESRRRPAPTQSPDYQELHPHASAGDTDSDRDVPVKGVRLTPSDEGQSKGEVTSQLGGEAVTQLSAISSGESRESRATPSGAAAAGAAWEGLDQTGTFGVVALNT